MYFLSFLVFTNLFLIPIFFHPFNICRHFIHIGHEPFAPKTLQINSYESHLYHLLEYSKSYIHLYPFHQHDHIFQRLWKYFFPKKSHLSTKSYYPNLIEYTEMYLYNHDLSPLIQSFLSMYISYFFLTYFSSLVHIYRISWKRKQSIDEIRLRAKQLIESSYVQWIIHALWWKFIGVIISHVFYIIAVKILMQRLFISYGHFYLSQDLMYSSWNIPKNIQLIYKYEGWKVFFSGIISRMIYEFGITLVPRLIWWPLRSLFFHSTVKSYFRASAIELYFLQCLCENFFRCFSIYLQLFARMSTLEIVNQMPEHINRKKYPLLSLLRHHHIHQPWSLPFSINRIDAKLIRKGLSIFLRQAN